MNLFDYFGDINVFGAAPDARAQSLLDAKLITPEAIEAANKRSIGTGIMTGLASYFAQPKNQNYGSVVPYLGKAYLNANKAAQAPFQGIADKYLMDTKIAENQRVLGQRNMTNETFAKLAEANPDLKQYLNMNVDFKNKIIQEMYTQSQAKPTIKGIKGSDDIVSISPDGLDVKVIRKGIPDDDGIKITNDRDAIANTYKGQINSETNTPYGNNVLFADLSRTDQVKVLEKTKLNEIDIAVQTEIAKDKSPSGLYRNAVEMGKRYTQDIKDGAFNEFETNFQKIEASLAQGTPISDVAAATQIMKLLDPGSVVRESELRVAMEANSLDDRIANWYARAIEGKILTPEQRKEFGALAKEFNDVSRKARKKIDLNYMRVADKHNLDKDLVLGIGKVPTYNPESGVIE